MDEVFIDSAGKTYEIKIEGHLNDSWIDWFEGVTFTQESDCTTTLSGEISNQAALHGFLKKIRDLGLPLLSVNRLNLDMGDSSMEN